MKEKWKWKWQSIWLYKSTTNILRRKKKSRHFSCYQHNNKQEMNSGVMISSIGGCFFLLFMRVRTYEALISMEWMSCCCIFPIKEKCNPIEFPLLKVLFAFCLSPHLFCLLFFSFCRISHTILFNSLLLADYIFWMDFNNIYIWNHSRLYYYKMWTQKNIKSAILYTK